MKIPSKVKKLGIQLFWAAISLGLIMLIAHIETRQKNIQSQESTSQQISSYGNRLSHDELDGLFGVAEKVVDGDTLWVQTKGEQYKIRMIGINAPELQHPTKGRECYGEEAAQFLEERIEGKEVIIRTDDSQDLFDRHDRLLAFIELGGEDVGAGLVREGYAKEFTYRKAHDNQGLYRSLQTEAQNQGKGLWSCGT